MRPFEIGARVIDRDSNRDEPAPAIVVNQPGIPCTEWKVYGREADTVAEDNPGYDDDEEVVIVMFEHTLRRHHPEYRANKPLILSETTGSLYGFPASRLKQIGTFEHPDDQDGEEQSTETDDDSEPQTDAADENGSEPQSAEPEQDDHDDQKNTLSEEMQALRDRLEQSATVTVDRDGTEPVLVVEKLGEAHRIRPDGTVSDGPLADRLEELVDKFLAPTP